MNALRFLEFIQNKTGREIPLSIKWTYFRDTIKEEDLTVEGDVSFAFNKKIKDLPDNLKITGELNVMRTNLEVLPKNLQVGTHLWLKGTDIHEIPEDTKVGKILCLTEMENIHTLPLHTGATTILADRTNISHLQDNISISTHLDISYTKVSEIPKNLRVWRLDIEKTPLLRKYTASEIKKLIEERGGEVYRLYITDTAYIE